MKSARLRYATLGALSIYWLSVVYSILHTMNTNQNVFPKPALPQTKIGELIISTIIFLILSFNQALYEFKKDTQITNEVRKVVSLLLFAAISVTFVFGYVFDSEVQSIGQTILNIGTALMDEDFDDLPPGSDPPGWDPLDGTWSTVDDGGNIVYYQDDNADKEALSISPTGNSSWIDYTYEVDVKFVEGNTKKDDHGALLLFRFQGGNSYYFLWMKEGLDTLELHNHGDGAHMVSSTGCILVQDTWYHVNVTIVGQNVWVSVDDIPYFSGVDMNGAFTHGNIAIGTSYYKVMFDNILVEPK
jgi:hypothetical protein